MHLITLLAQLALALAVLACLAGALWLLVWLVTQSAGSR